MKRILFTSLIFTTKTHESSKHRRNSQSRSSHTRPLILSSAFSFFECVLRPHRRKLLAYPEASLKRVPRSLIASSISTWCVFPCTFERKQWFRERRRYRCLLIGLPRVYFANMHLIRIQQVWSPGKEINRIREFNSKILFFENSIVVFAHL